MDLDKAQSIPAADDRELGQADALGRAEPVAWSTIGVLVAALALSLWSIPRTIQAGDAGEFATVMLTGGVPHPSGYPWMRMLGLVARGLWAIGLPPAIAAALPPALCGVAAWVMLQRCCLRLGRAWSGAAVVVWAAASPLAVIHVNDSEVWGPHLLFSAVFIHTVIATRLGSARPVSGKSALLLGLCLGLAVSHHLTAIWLIPLAVAAASPRRSAEQPWREWLIALARNGALGLAGSLLGLLSFASLAIGHDGGWVWGDVHSLDGFVHHVTRGDYGTFSLSLHEEQVAASETVGRALISLGEVFSAGLVASPVFGGLVLVGACAGAWTLGARIGRGVAVAWMLSLLACGVGFPAMQNIDPTGPFGAWILERFDLLTVLLVIVPLVAGLGWVADRLRPRLGLVRAGILEIGGAAIAVVLLLAQLGAVAERGRPRTEAAIERTVVDMLETPDPTGPAIPSADGPPIRAIVFGTDDHRSFPALYAQTVLGAGSHTLYIDAQLLAHPWYRARLRDRVPTLPDVDKPLKMIGAIWSDPELQGVPIYLANVFSAPADRLAKVPEGLLWRIPPPTDHPSFVADDWSPDAIAARHLAAYARYRIRPEDFAGLEHPRGHPWSADLWHAYVDKGSALAAMLAQAGHESQAKQVLDALEHRTGQGGG